ncbi:hypothetical protein nublan009_35430 [Klebsiella pneumoniae]|nr:hypothetical protein NUBL22817_45360 [Klebsiella pneumoniae]
MVNATGLATTATLNVARASLMKAPRLAAASADRVKPPRDAVDQVRGIAKGAAVAGIPLTA